MAETTTDHAKIKKWAEKHGGKPAAVDSTHSKGDVGIIRLMFPKAQQSEHGSLVEISWDEFFEQFEESGLALIYDENSNFNKIIGRDTADRRSQGENDAARHKERGYAGDHRSSGGGGAQAKGGGDDLKSREYRDEDGTVHHHTRAYMEEHEKGKGRG
jgi:hypothetical protein